jgi:hypothetical protein
MRTSTRRRGALTAVLGLVLGTTTVALGGGVAHAGSATTTNACFSNATATYSDLDWTLSGAASPNPATLGSDPTVTLSGSTVGVNIPATLLIAGYNLGLLTVGENEIPTVVYVSRKATNVDTGGGVGGSVHQVDNFSIVATTTITDPDGTPGTGDESATPLEVNESLPDFAVAPTGGNIQFSQGDIGTLPLLPAGVAGNTAVQPNGSVFASASVAGGLIRANFDCFPGTTIIDPPGGTSGSQYTPATPAAFETVTVNAPPTAPVCANESRSVGVTQSIPIDLRDNCTDINEDQGGGSPFVFSVDDTGLAGTLTETGAPGEGLYTYEAPASDPGVADTFTFTATDTSGLVSNVATVSISILANQCDATNDPCTLTQIVVQPVVGTVLTFDKEPGVIQMSTVVLDGDAQVSTGTLNQVTVTNARGTAAGWSLTAYSTDIGADGGPTLELTPLGLPGVIIPSCTLEGGQGFFGATDPASVRDRLCIPGNNLAWTPSAEIVHDVIYGDVAEVVPGPALASDDVDWREQLVAAGNANAGGLGGLQATNSLCSAPTNQSGGTFQCDAAMYLGVPASAGAGLYTGALVMTLT